jgi:ribonuclease VapC
MATGVLDSWVLMALFNDEPGAEHAEKLLRDAVTGGYRLLMCVVNWGEVYYSIMRAQSQNAAEEKTRQIAALPIELVPVEADLALARQAAVFKARHKLSYADAFAAGLARIRKAELITGDPEFKVMEDEIKIHWVRG